jgi:hypothetical protein
MGFRVGLTMGSLGFGVGFDGGWFLGHCEWWCGLGFDRCVWLSWASSGGL